MRWWIAWKGAKTPAPIARGGGGGGGGGGGRGVDTWLTHRACISSPSAFRLLTDVEMAGSPNSTQLTTPAEDVPRPCSQMMLEEGTVRGMHWLPPGNCTLHRYNKRSAIFIIHNNEVNKKVNVAINSTKMITHYTLTKITDIHTGRKLWSP